MFSPKNLRLGIYLDVFNLPQENLLLEVMFDIPGSDIGSVHVHEGCVARSEAPSVVRRRAQEPAPAPADPAADERDWPSVRIHNCT